MRSLRALVGAWRQAPPPPPVAAPPERGAVTHVVRAGEDLWAIAARHLAAETGQSLGELDDAQVGDYWRRVIHANRATLRTGDPDLLLPGEIVVLPPPRR